MQSFHGAIKYEAVKELLKTGSAHHLQEVEIMGNRSLSHHVEDGLNNIKWFSNQMACDIHSN